MVLVGRHAELPDIEGRCSEAPKLKLPLAVRAVPAMTYYVVDADGQVLGSSETDAGAHRIKQEIHETMGKTLMDEALRAAAATEQEWKPRLVRRA